MNLIRSAPGRGDGGNRDGGDIVDVSIEVN